MPASRQSRHPRPRWIVRGVVAAIGVALGWAADRAVRSPAALEYRLRPDRDWRILIDSGCFAIGSFPPLATAEQEVRGYFDTPEAEQFPSISDPLRDRLRLAKHVQIAAASARLRGVEMIEHKNGLIVVIAGWIVSIIAVPFVFPLLFGAYSIFVRRRRFFRQLCQTCAYPLFGLPEPRCPECGERVAVNVAQSPSAGAQSPPAAGPSPENAASRTVASDL